MYTKIQDKIAIKKAHRINHGQIKRKRGIKRNNKSRNQILKIFGINAAGIKSKIKSFDNVLSRLKPHIWAIQETKLKPHETIKCGALDEYQVFTSSRQKSQGGGVALGVHKMLESTLIREGDDDCEVISVLVVVGNMRIRVVVAYGVQENALKEKKEKFWKFMENEVVEAEQNEEGIIIEMDGNLHAGKDLVKSDPNPQNINGKLFMQFLQQNRSLSVVNSLSMCEGTITRRRQLETRLEEAVLDFIVVNDKLNPFIKKMVIDEKREYVLSNFAQQKKNRKVIETDHNALILDVSLQFSKKENVRHKMFNLKNRECQLLFNLETENNNELLECFENELPFEAQSKKWLKTFNNILYKCFKKVRICDNKKKSENEQNSLLNERIKLKQDEKKNTIDDETRKKIQERIRYIENEIGEETVQSFHRDIVEAIKGLGGDETAIDGTGRRKLWKVLKAKFPKNKNAFPVGKKDIQGNLITNHLGLKNLYLKTYINRLRNRPIRKDYLELQYLRQVLFNLREKLCKKRKSDPWQLYHLENVIKELKNDKSRDPNDWINEIFKPDVAGKNLKLSMLKMFNRIKDRNEIPEFIRKADIATIYKGKGEKADLKNDRGVFIVSVFRSILMKLVYKDIYQIIDNSMSDSQIGSRKGRNIRNHIWIINSIICDILNDKKKKPIDIQVYDYKQCFDSLWLEECMNDMFTGGLQDDKFNLLYNANSLVKIVVRTPVGKTESDDIKNVVIQGDVFGPLLCSKQADLIGKESLEKHKYTYLYKDEVEIPPLTMVDDVIFVAECGYKSAMANSYMQSKTNSKKLQFGGEKCKKIHVGKKEEFKCGAMFVDKWNEIEKKNEKNGKIEVEDICVGKEEMEDKEEECYLGDIISKDGKNIKNIKRRIIKGKGIVQRISNILKDIPFGKLFFQVAKILRNSLLVSSLLCNSEAWFKITKSELELLESVDVILLRSILEAPKATPKEMLYLELGVLPLGENIRERRLNFLHYILNQNSESLMFKVFEKQSTTRNKSDWVNTVCDDMEEVGLNVTFVQIQQMSKRRWKNMVKTYVEKNALGKLNDKKKSHSKVKMLEHPNLEMQSYLVPNRLNVTKEEIQFIFKMRCKVVNNVKMNQQNNHENHECRICEIENESQEHIYECNERLKLMKTEYAKIPKYEKIMNGSIREKIEVSRIFKELMNVEKL